jgi:hypothetical protein
METRDVVLTDEMRAKLKKSLGFNLNAEFKYVLKAFREACTDKTSWPVFVLRSRDGIQISKDEDAIGAIIEYNADTRTTKTNVRSGEQRVRILSDGIVEVKGFWLNDGVSRVSWKEGKLSTVGGQKEIERQATVNEVIRFIPISVQIELANAITENDTLTEEELRGLE